jgi:uncharacterized membrane protein YhaH (DUF805 family)
MNFAEAIKSGFSNYVNFSDRAARSELWWWFLFVSLVTVATAAIDMVMGVTLTYPIWALATILPNLSIQVRRLHDTDRSGWFILLSLIPLVGAIILLIWYCTKGTEGANRFGPDRLAALGALSPRPAI